MRLTLSLHLLFAVALIVNEANAQTLSMQSVNSAGAKFANGKGSLTFTVGELVIDDLEDSNGNSLSNGFTSGSVITTTPLGIVDPSIIDISVFPNPTLDDINVTIKHSSFTNVQVLITDIKGSTVYVVDANVHTGLIQIPSRNFASGTYILQIKAPNGNLLNSYKIIKN